MEKEDQIKVERKWRKKGSWNQANKKNENQTRFKTEHNPADKMCSAVLQEDLYDDELNWTVHVT